jgi:hypothetical protein
MIYVVILSPGFNMFRYKMPFFIWIQEMRVWNDSEIRGVSGYIFSINLTEPDEYVTFHQIPITFSLKIMKNRRKYKMEIGPSFPVNIG